MRNALVTGGAGFIGSHLTEALLKSGWQVTVVDNFDDFYSRDIKQQNIQSHHNYPGFRLLQIDIRDYGALKSALSDAYDIIIHLAAKAGVRASIEEPTTYQEVNILGTQNLLEVARLCRIRQFVFASSSSVYGLNARVPW